MILRVTLPDGASAREYAFDRSEALIGSGRRTDVRIPLRQVALRHARLRRDAGRVWLEPLRPGLTLVIERDQVGRIKSSSPIALRPGDLVQLTGDEGTAVIELVAVAADTRPRSEAETLFRLSDAAGQAPPPLLEAVNRFALAVAAVEQPSDLPAALERVAHHFTIGDEVATGLVLFGHEGRTPRWLVPGPLGASLRENRGLMAGSEWRRPARHRLAAGEVLQATAETGSNLVVVPMMATHTLHGVWIFGLGRGVALEALQAVAGGISQLLVSALERLDLASQLGALREENRYFRNRERRHYLYKELVTQSEAMQAVYDQVNRLVNSSKAVLIVGEKGSGKEMLARALHHLSDRAAKLMISQHCSELSETDLDLELFGRLESSASINARSCPGLLELADEGTLFLEGIERLPLRLQTKLSRVVLEHEVRPRGATIGRPVDVRIVVSSEGDLFPLAESGHFRKDLYLHLLPQTIRLPPLRERVDDIVPLANVFVANLAGRYRRSADRVAESLHETLRGYAWPGNVRELQGYIEAAVIATDPAAPEITHLPGLSE